MLNPIVKNELDEVNEYGLSCFKITLTKGETSTSFLLSEVSQENSLLDLGNLYLKEETTFSIKTEFLEESNNKVQNCSLTYSLSLDAVQIIK